MSKGHSPGWSRLFVPFALTILMLTLSSWVAEAGQLPILNWTPRSDWINVKTAYGARGNGATDDTAAIQAALTNATNGANVYFPPGTYKVTDTLNLKCSSEKFAIVLVGCGRFTTLQWHGAEGADFFRIDSNPYGRYEGLTLDGRGIAGIGFHHNNTAWFQTSIRHKHLAFYNFKEYGAYADGNGGTATAETSFENCIFSKCVTAGANIYWFNQYDFTFAGCDFSDCKFGILCNFGNCYIRDCFFQNNGTDINIGGEHGSSVRRCKSVGSGQFLYCGGGISPFVVQDCYVASWKGEGFNKTTGAIALTSHTPLSLSHCRFVNPPNDEAPVQARGRSAIILNNNEAPDSPDVINASPECILYDVPAGKYPSKVGGPKGDGITTFVNDTVPVPTKVFDAKVDFGAVGDRTADDTAAIQKTIDAARNAGGGAIAYLPKGTYKITSTLNIAGGNYVVGGSGYFSQIFWQGADGGTLVSVNNPSDVRMENMIVGHGDGGGVTNNRVDIDQTATNGPSKMIYDGIYVFGKYADKPETKGIRLNGLNSSCTVILNMVEGNIRVMNCADATIVGNICYEGAITVDDTISKRTGIFGIQSRLSTSNTYGVIVRNSNNIVMSDWYQEQNKNGVFLSGEAGNPDGRITIQSPNTDISDGHILDIDNYKGKVFYGPSQVYAAKNPVKTIVQRGTNNVELVLWGHVFYETSLSLTGPTAKMKSLGNWKVLGNGKPPQDNYSKETLAGMTAAYDDLQRLGTLDLALNFPHVPL